MKNSPQKHRIIQLLLLLITLVLFTIAPATRTDSVKVGATHITSGWDLTLPSLAETYKDYFMIGNVMSAHQTLDANLTAMYKHHYNLVTAENDMKPQYLSPAKGFYYFIMADMLINWAAANNIKVHGHTLVWHSQSATWLTTGVDGKPLTGGSQANLQEYITSVAGHFRGK